ncbi:glycosyltransferase family 2 protein [Acetobacter orientalis]|nr:glycosyltransferase family 2 protein [Acetobacter orientalis]MCP1217605.1 glycosyltransferase family 2 protein [Acetobacter orientalis]
MQESAEKSTYIRGIKLSRNMGHQTALLAGLNATSSCAAVISIDADLQDDIYAIRKMLDAWQNGFEIVYGVRDDRSTDTVFKRQTAKFFYKIMHLLGIELVSQHADFRLLDHKALQALLQYNENNLFLRGLIPLIGFSTTSVHYSRLKRIAGTSKYPLARMISLAVEGITSLSVAPLRAIAIIGLFVTSIATLCIVYALLTKLFSHAVSGWTSVTIAIFFMGGVQMLSLAIIGEYIGKIYLETKRRPRYHIQSTKQKK